MTLQRRRLDGAPGRANDVVGHRGGWWGGVGWGWGRSNPLPLFPSTVFLTGPACGPDGRRPPVLPVINYSRGIEFLQPNKSGEKVAGTAA